MRNSVLRLHENKSRNFITNCNKMLTTVGSIFLDSIKIFTISSYPYSHDHCKIVLLKKI